MRHRLSGRLAVAFIAGLAVLVVTGGAPPADEPAARTPISQDQRTGPIYRRQPARGSDRDADRRSCAIVRGRTRYLEDRRNGRAFWSDLAGTNGPAHGDGFVRINVVLILLRQALGSPQVPGNQVLTALSLLLTALVMWPIGEKVYHDAVVPYKSKQLELAQAWDAGSQPIKLFMIDQIKRTNHEEYLQVLYDYAVPKSPGRANPDPARSRDFPLRVVAPPTCSAS